MRLALLLTLSHTVAGFPDDPGHAEESRKNTVNKDFHFIQAVSPENGVTVYGKGASAWVSWPIQSPGWSAVNASMTDKSIVKEIGAQGACRDANLGRCSRQPKTQQRCHRGDLAGTS
jgi:hypothetical protein